MIQLGKYVAENMITYFCSNLLAHHEREYRWHRFSSHGIPITRDRVFEVMKELDPGGEGRNRQATSLSPALTMSMDTEIPNLMVTPAVTSVLVGPSATCGIGTAACEAPRRCSPH